MGRVAKMAVRTAEQALEQAGLLEAPELSSGRVGVSYGSSTGSPGPIGNFYQAAHNGDTKGLNATSYIQMMSHTCAVNIGLFFRTARTATPHEYRLHIRKFRDWPRLRGDQVWTAGHHDRGWR